MYTRDPSCRSDKRHVYTPPSNEEACVHTIPPTTTTCMLTTPAINTRTYGTCPAINTRVHIIRLSLPPYHSPFLACARTTSHEQHLHLRSPPYQHTCTHDPLNLPSALLHRPPSVAYLGCCVHLHVTRGLTLTHGPPPPLPMDMLLPARRINSAPLPNCCHTVYTWSRALLTALLLSPPPSRAA